MKLNDLLIIINDKRCEVAGLLDFDVEVPFNFMTMASASRVEIDEEKKIIKLR